MKILLVFLMVYTLTLPAFGKQCQDLTPEKIEELRYLDWKNRVFYSSWCLACADSIKKAGKEAVFIAVFDESESAAQALASLKGDDASCLFDKDGLAAKAFGVKTLPFHTQNPKH